MCSIEEIENKRQLALRKLALKNSANSLKDDFCSTTSTKLPEQPNNSNYSCVAARFNYKSHNSSPRSLQHNAKPYDKTIDFLKPSGNDKTTKMKCSLISEDRFVVELTEFDIRSIDIFKTIPTRHYNSQTKNWDFQIRDYHELIMKMQSLKPPIVIEQLPKFVLRCVNNEKEDYSNIDLSCLDLELGGALMPFQQEGVRFGISKSGRCLIADDMGLGKTFQALAIANYYLQDWPLLIVTTASMKNIWEQTIHKYLPSVPVIQVQYMTSAKDYIGDAQILIISHDMMTRSIDNLLKRSFGVIIVDESHNLKNIKAKCTKAATALAKKAKRVILLSGTPALSRPSELFSQLNLIDEKFFGNFYEYSRRYCNGQNTNFGWDASGKSNLQELEIVLAKKFMIRRTKDDVLKALPNKSQEIVYLNVNLNEFNEDDKKCLETLAVKYESIKKSLEKHSILLTFFSETAKIKIPFVCSYILQTLKYNKKFLLFAHHQIMLDAVSNLLDKKNVKYIRIDGNTTSEQRKYFVDKFQTNDKYLVAVLSITAANAGITLTAAQLVLFAELHWNPSILSQAESRAHRIGQTNSVTIRYLLAKGTADDSIWPMLQQKQKILQEVGLSKNSFDDATIKPLNKQKISINNISATTSCITSYFKSTKSDDCQVFDDGLNDVLCNIDM